jgi:hypothetical protein
VPENRHTWLRRPFWLVSVLLIVEAAAATFSASVERGLASVGASTGGAKTHPMDGPIQAAVCGQHACGR